MISLPNSTKLLAVLVIDDLDVDSIAVSEAPHTSFHYAYGGLFGMNTASNLKPPPNQQEFHRTPA